MSFLLLIFIISLVIEILLLNFTSPDESQNTFYHLLIFIFSLNTATLIGSFISLLLVVSYLVLKAYEDLANGAYIRRGVLVGVTVFSLLMLKLYELLDIVLLVIIPISVITLEIILSYKGEHK